MQAWRLSRRRAVARRGEDASMDSAIEVAEAVRAGKRRASDVLEECLAEIERANPVLNAFVHVAVQDARAGAAAIDARVTRGEDPGRLAGVPFGIKDLEDCRGMPTAKGSLFHVGDPPAGADAPQVARLRAAGAVPIGKVATAEFGLDGVTHTLAFGTARNPWNPERTPSGSSGGSAAAVSSGMVPFCTASDGGGSTRCPAAFTGLVGHKPSHGRIPRAHGFAETTNPGALTVTVADTARYLDVASGPDDRDRMSLPAPDVCYERIVEVLDVSGLRAVWSEDLGFAPVEPEVAALAHDAARQLATAADLVILDRGFECTNTYMDWNAIAAERLRAQLELEGFLPGRHGELSPGPRSFIDRFGRLDPRDRARRKRRIMQLEREVAALFSEADVLLTPTACCVAYAAEGPLPETIAGRDASQTNGEPFTMVASSCWLPSVSVPAGVTSEGLPVGLLINGRRHRDDVVLRLARILEQVRPWPRHAA
jgi:aspartyl-tRNA(Asn)/glutamyl-tRNA(Gln) amidotransferase subunit A